ncbi:hypothetical protein BegalDRAFT_1718 [Beggiatoa alba B18LD]|uniref:DUF302 domain-containing protein n=1 Tax=Beggiatoa alba B18LD TaxID=395493 RepID=I3CG53_9GAMM|nr:hypothetical protein [Beggiatoa alba]EIJ42596.1 hypothetical protein BegalDRAFT_1718 [Beggiatoa alba B18LD]
MMRIVIFLCFLIPIKVFSTEAVTAQDVGALYIYQVKADINEVKSAIEMAIVNQGLLISNTLHLSDMLNRTGQELGFTTPVYQFAEAVEFCSAKLAHQMAQLHPANLATCPLTISFYTTPDDNKMVSIAFRKVQLIGESATVTAVSQAVTQLLKTIIDEAIDGL